MKIRSITCFYNPILPTSEKFLENFLSLTKEVTEQLEIMGFEVQTRRLATPPFPELLAKFDINSGVQLAQRVESEAMEKGFAYISLGPALPLFPESYGLIPSMLTATQNVFFDGIMADAHTGVSLEAVKSCASVIAEATTISEDGFANLRFAALANISPFNPFFPSAYHSGSEPAFSLAIESADIAIDVFSHAKNLNSARTNLLYILESNAKKIARICKKISKKYNVSFKGLDISLAPFPGDLCSLGKAIELLGPQQIGLLGSVAAAAFIADTLDLGNWLKVGFNGLMLPVLEDSILAERTSNGCLGIKDLLLYSAVCGAGLDTVPLPGNASIEQLFCILLDVASLSVRLGKPLTARLMPIPGKVAGDRTEFNFDYFANGRVLELPAKPLNGLLSGSEKYKLHPRITFS